MCPRPITEKDISSGIVPPIMISAPWRVKDVRPLPRYRLLVGFMDGSFGLVDMSAMIHSPEAGVFAALRDEDLFRQAHIFLGAVTWPGELDLAPDAMYDEIKANGEWVLK